MRDRQQHRLEQELEALEKQYDLWTEKLNQLAKAKIRENDTATIFKLDTQIAEAQAEIEILKLKIRLIEEQLSNIFKFLSPGNDFTNPVPASLSELDFSGVSEDIIQQAYQDSLPPDAGVWGLAGDNISQKIDALKQFGRLSDFFDRLIQDENLSLAVRDRLQSISNQLALKKSPETTKNRSLQNSGEDRAKQLKSYLIATLTPDDIDRDRFLLNAWLIIDDRFQDCSTFHLQDLSRFQPLIDENEQQQGKLCRLPPSDRSESTNSQTSRLPQVDKELDCLLKKALKILRGKRYDLTIEIFLPSSLMYVDVDRWKIDDSIADVTLGIRYPIRLRSLERLNPDYLDAYHSNWQKCWDNVRVVLENESIQDIFEHLENVESFNWKLLKIKLKEKIGLKVTCTHPKSMSTDLFKAILQATTPVAIWIRNDISDLDRVTAIDEILTFRPLAHLCESVRQTRELADAQDAEHIGLHLAVLWENPYRLTPDVMVELKPVGY